MGRDLSGPIYFEARVTEYLRQFFIELGCRHEVIEVSPGRCNVLAKFDSPGATQTFLLDAHQDTVPVDGKARPAELVYSERMTAALERFAPDAPEALRLAARAQHLQRWQLPRRDY
ncbi:MAG: DUF4202 family protein, partial [Rhodopirellula sp.]|nr:DUF4202 family protein [Rhodopirellula sp.]